jgi:hypothetical protein
MTLIFPDVPSLLVWHDAEFSERLLFGSALDCHIAAVYQYPQALPI